jgi:hypothetical protein
MMLDNRAMLRKAAAYLEFLANYGYPQPETRGGGKRGHLYTHWCERRENWIRVGMVLHAADVGDEYGLKLWALFSATYDTATHCYRKPTSRSEQNQWGTERLRGDLPNEWKTLNYPGHQV